MAPSTRGVEDVIDSSGFTQLNITGGSYQPTSSDTDNSNNAGTLTITTNSGTTHYLAVLDSAGDIQFIQTASGSGSGVAEKTPSPTVFNTAAQTYAFGLSGFGSTSARVGYAGVLSLNGSTSITSGEMDINDNGNTSNGICASPCSVGGIYSYNAGTNVGALTLNASASEDFDFFVANGSASANTPVNVFIISRGNGSGTIDGTHPALLGTMVLQDSATTYNTAGLNGPSISALTGTNGNVSLTNGNADGNGGFMGTFDWNNDGAMISVPPEGSTCAQPTVCSFSYTYAAAGSNNNGRYTLHMLGNPNGSPAVAALPFVLYASEANSGFLLDQSSAVITGTMTAQSNSVFESFQPAALPGTFAVATASNSLPSIAPLTMNLLLTSPGNAVFNVSGTENPGGIAITGGAYGVQTVSPTPALSTTTGAGTSNYVLYQVDLTHFYLMRDATKDTGVPSAILFVAE